MANLFALIHPITKKTGIFPQLGSVVPGRLCIENCLNEKYGKRNISWVWLSRNTTTRCLFLQQRATGEFHTKDGVYFVYRITPRDPLYRKNAIVKQYEDFFGNTTVTNTLYNRMVAGDYKERKAVLVAALGGFKNWLQVNKLIK